jgi:two-component system chemotaxis response regulator CheB
MLADDSEVIRFLYTKALERDGDIQVVASVGNGIAAVEMAKLHQPDAILLDIEMPKMDGLAALPLLQAACAHSKIIIVSGLLGRQGNSLAMDALAQGACDCIIKPGAQGAYAPEQFHNQLRQKLRALCTRSEPPPHKQPPLSRPYPRMTRSAIAAIGIAASTGGPSALLTLFGGLKHRLPDVPFFITQHMPVGMTTVLARHIADAAGAQCTEARDGQPVQNGHIYLAPGGCHMTTVRVGTQVHIRLTQDEPVNSCRPSANPMFRSLSNCYGQGLLAVVLTGLGSDGALGAQEVAHNGGTVIAQDAASCVVYGMPAATARLGICEAILPLGHIAACIREKCAI